MLLKNWGVTAGARAAAIVTLLCASALVPTTAAAAGGKSIASATPVAYGVQQFGNTADDQFLKESCSFWADGWRSYWSLAVTAGDLVTINWEGVPSTELKLMPIGTTDFNLFQTNPVLSESLSSNGKNQAQYTVPQTGVMPLYFRLCGEEPGPYDFLVTTQHGLAVSFPPRENIRTTSLVYGGASLSNGAPAPDGMTFTLTATWPSGSATYSAASVGGGLSFQLALPEEAEGQTAKLAISRPSDSQYLEAKSAEIKVKVARTKAAAPTPKPHRKKRHHHHRRHHHRHHHHHRH
jgi:hypothetical protein